jgi:hypothetical protein
MPNMSIALSLKAVGNGLKTFKSTKQVLTVIANAMEGASLYHHLPNSNVLKATLVAHDAAFLMLGYSIAILA